MTSAEIRQQFLDFFIKKHGHAFVASSPVVPLDDPTLLFTNAGMNQFKPIFLGQEKRDYTRVANTQKCIRAGGKHNDLDDVGRSRRHQTFFEMLGNWSFGDYFKRGAIEMAWELLTQVFKLDPSRLHVTCYQGDEKAGIPRDTEAAAIWKDVARLPDDHIHFLGKENFWEMADTGPCGPCTEIFIDRTPEKTGGPSVEKDDDPRVMEFWNLVFIQYNRDATGKLTPLPAQHVDTGMGFERLCQILQDKADNYGTDLWTPLFAKIAEISGLKYTGLFPKSNVADPAAEAASPQLRYDIAFRVVADHARCLTFALTDGATPSNEGRGYVLRRILRRAVRFGRQQLNLHEPFLHKLVPVIVESMGEAFPELKKNPNHVVELIRDEEISFGKTLDRGIELFEEAADRAIAAEYVSKHQGEYTAMLGGGINRHSFEIREGDGNHRVVPLRDARDELLRDARVVRISEGDAFKLHDTYGFPIDLTRIMAEERGMSVDIAGYEKLMEQARELARAGGKAETTKLHEIPASGLAALAASGAPATDDSAKFSHDAITAKILAIWNGTDLGLSPANAFEDEELAIILDRTNFYAEMGGQIGDSGVVASATMSFDVETTRSIGQYILHVGRVRSGSLRVGETVTATVSKSRAPTEQNHTSTHLANWGLREVLGDSVQQKGSLVDAEKLRFDFVHNKPMSEQEIERVEMLVNERITKPQAVYTEIAPQEKALKINGLRAVFGEKYPPMVRIVSIGAAVKDLLADPSNEEWRQFSIEFCGGTHLKTSSEARAFVIVAEESVSKGIRRIVALTGDSALNASVAGVFVELLMKTAKQKADTELPSAIAEINKQLTEQTIPLRTKRRAQAAVTELQARLKAAQKSAKGQAAGGSFDVAGIAEALLARALDVGGAKVVVDELKAESDEQLRSVADSLQKRNASGAAMLGAVTGERVSFVAIVSDELIKKGLKAGDWIRETAKVAGGGGGGRPQMAQAGGKDPSKLGEALEKARQVARDVLK